MNDFSILIGGKAGDGINQASLIIARILNQLGYYLYIYYDYPSLIRGGHNFSIIRASKNKIAAYLNKIDLLLALNQDCIDLHKNKLKENSFIIYNSSLVKSETGVGIPLNQIIKEENAPSIMLNSVIIGAFCKALGVNRDILEKVFKKNISKEIDLNLKVAYRGYAQSEELTSMALIDRSNHPPIITGNEAISLGLINSGLKTYLAYPMTPSSSILHFFASNSENLSIKVIHPENEISVILMALGFSYTGDKVAIGTSGGGFCLMTEGLSLAAMAELPIVIIVSQRPGPSTGMPTYTAQGDLHFVLNAGQGEFPRFVVSPGDPEEAYFWGGMALNISWKYQIPSIILSDKLLSESSYSFEIESMKKIEETAPILWDEKYPYKRYLNTETGISPLAFVPNKDAIIKVNSYEHDEFGITTEDAAQVKMMQDKRLRKEENLIKELDEYELVKVYGNKNSKLSILCWGSNKGVCVEAGENLNLKIIHLLTLSPFPVRQFQEAVKGAEKIICVENNLTSQLVKFINCYGFKVDEKILKYDGRPFSLDELEDELKRRIK